MTSTPQVKWLVNVHRHNQPLIFLDVSTQNCTLGCGGWIQGNNKTTLRKEPDLFLSREGSLVDFYQGEIHKQNKIHMCGWLKQRKHTLGYGVTKILWIIELFAGEILQMQGSILLQSKCCWYGDKEEKWLSINTEHWKDEFCINFGWKGFVDI